METKLTPNDKMLFALVGVLYLASFILFFDTTWVLFRTYRVKGTILKTKKVTLSDKRHTVVTEATIKYKAKNKNEYEFVGRVASHFSAGNEIPVRVYKNTPGEAVVFLDGFPFTKAVAAFAFATFMFFIAFFQAKENAKKANFKGFSGNNFNKKKDSELYELERLEAEERNSKKY